MSLKRPLDKRKTHKKKKKRIKNEEWFCWYTAMVFRSLVLFLFVCSKYHSPIYICIYIFFFFAHPFIFFIRVVFHFTLELIVFSALRSTRLNRYYNCCKQFIMWLLSWHHTLLYQNSHISIDHMEKIKKSLWNFLMRKFLYSLFFFLITDLG